MYGRSHTAILLMIAAASLANVSMATASPIPDTCNNPSSSAVDLLKDEWLDKPFIFVGELHGNNETPDLTAALVCRLTQEGHRVLLALETSENVQILTTNEAGEIAFEEDDDGLSASYWLPEKHYGRTSHAMIRLIDVTKASVPIAFVDVPWPWAKTVGNRDKWMANNLQKHQQTGNYDHIVFHGGNFHTRLTNREPDSGTSVLDYLNSIDVVSIAVFAAKGETWACFVKAGCGLHAVGRGHSLAKPTIKVPSNENGLPYSFVITLPEFTPSFPLNESEGGQQN